MSFTPWQRVLLRFAIIFFPLYIILNPNGFIPKIDDFYNWYILPFHSFIPWVGSHLLHLSYPITHFTYGSGDTTYDYLMLALNFLLALLGTAIWSLAESSHPRDYTKAYKWLLIIIRYYLAFSMLEYGFAKVFYLQFTAPSFYRLQQSIGSASPMGLAWTFFGYSKPYNWFTGGAECLAGILLLFRRTTRIGAILALVILANVMAINYCFDVCVKLTSTMLTIMSIILMVRDWQPHCNFFLTNRHADPDTAERPQFGNHKLDRSVRIFKCVLITYVLAGNIWQCVKYLREYASDGHPPLAGIYDVHHFVLNGETLPPLQTDTVRWRKLIISYSGRASLKMMNDSLRGFNFEPDTSARRIVIYSDADTMHKYQLAYSRPAPDSLTIEGRWRGDSIRVTLKRYDDNKFVLTNRGFHFINETPFSR